jgi:hypothetical protein
MRNRVTVWTMVGIIGLIALGTSFLGWKGFVGAVGGILATALAVAVIMIAEPVSDEEEFAYGSPEDPYVPEDDYRNDR